MPYYSATALHLSADAIEYDYNVQHIVASSNVDISAYGLQVETQKLDFRSNKNSISIPHTFKLYNTRSSFTGDSLNYDLDSLSGHISCLEGSLGRTHITGEEVIINESELIFNDASFSTCTKDSDSVTYEIQSDRLTFYPQLGYFLAQDNRLSISFLPFKLWIPAFVYGSGRYSVFSNSSGLPNIGSSQREGLFLKQQFGYFLGDSINGSFDLGYLSNLGGYLGGTIQYVLDKESYITAGTHIEGSDGYTGHFHYSVPLNHFFSSYKRDDKTWEIEQNFSFLYDSSRDYSAFFRLFLDYRRLEEFYRLSKLPMTELHINNFKSLWNTSFNFLVGYGWVEEEDIDDSSLISSSKLTLSSSSKYPVLSTTWVLSEMQWDVLYNQYTSQSWSRSFVSWRNTFYLPYVTPAFAYHKQLANSGGPFFRYEPIIEASEDEIEIDLEMFLSVYKLLVKGFYQLEKKSWRQLDFKMMVDYGCWSAGILWRTEMDSIGLVISLAEDRTSR